MKVTLQNPIMVALDVDSRDKCITIAKTLKGKVGAFKLGPRLIVRYGSDLISEVAQLAPVFVDNKYLDIPSTMDAAIRASFDAGASFATVHAWAGSEALTLLANTEKELNQKRPFQILAVTILTSYNPQTLPPPLGQFTISDQVRTLADLAITSGITGLVCSAEEVSDLRKRHPNSYLVTPGIRLPDEGRGDQKRVMGPREAMASGSSALVIGRPIVEAADPSKAADRILAALHQ
jgi:orotidine-5'-phosphate decarboxylase